METSLRLENLVQFIARYHSCNHKLTGVPDFITLPNLYSTFLVYELFIVV